MIERMEEPLTAELYDLCRATFDTHIGIDGHTGYGLQPDFRKTECRYIQRAKRRAHPRAIQLMEEYINDMGYPNYTPEILQIARYHEGHFYKWHKDGAGRGYRKLSMSCLLNDPSEFEGGEFQVRIAGQEETIPLAKREVVLFFPDLEHQVAPVKSGVRDSLVVWFIEK